MSHIYASFPTGIELGRIVVVGFFVWLAIWIASLPFAMTEGDNKRNK